MPRFKTQAVIINTVNFSESDKIVAMLSQGRGLINAMAKGAMKSMKRFPGTLEPFNEIEAELYIKPGADLFRIEEAKLVNANLAIRDDLEVYAHASVMLEVIALNLAPMDPHPSTFDILKKALVSMSAEKRWFPSWASALFGILESIGYGIDIKSIHERGEPLPANSLSGEALRFMESSFMKDEGLLTRIHMSDRACKEIRFYLTALCEKVSGRPLRTVDFLKGIQ